ncbi:MAG: Lrp/AsnC family transcriptional regulator [Candidatus Hodarchaeales archaeon]
MVHVKKNQFDDLDWKLLYALKNNPRASIRELAEELQVHRNTITNRLQKEDEEELIHHMILPNYKRLGTITAYILANSMPNSELNQQDTALGISKLEGVEEVSVISGNWDFIIKIRARSMEQIGEKIIEDLRKLSGISSTITCITFWSFQGEKPFDLVNSQNLRI